MSNDRNEQVTLGGTDSLNTTADGQLMHLDELNDFKIADGEPDIRGWDVRTTDGQKVGKVEDLLVDTAAMKVRYIEVKLEKDVARDVATGRSLRADSPGEVAAAHARSGAEMDNDADIARYVLVPIGVARLDDEDDDVLLDARAAQMVGIPAYSRDTMTREYEREVLRGYGGGVDQMDGLAGMQAIPSTDRITHGDPFYADRSFDDRSFLGGRREPRDEWSYVRRADDVDSGAERGSGARRSDVGRDIARRDRDLLDSPSDLDTSVRDQINNR